MTGDATALSGWQMLGHRDYRTIFAAEAISRAGDGATSLAVLLLLTSWSDNPGIIALYTIGSAIPFVLFAPFSGIAVDRYNRLRLVIAGRVARAVLIAALVFLTADMLWLFVLLIVLQYSVATLTGAAAQSIFAAVVPENGRAGASGLDSASGFLMRVVGSGVTAWLFAVDLLYVAFLLDAVTFVVAGLLMVRLRGRVPTHVDIGGKAKPFRRELFSGARVVRGSKGLRSLFVGLAVFTVVSATVNVLYAPLMVDTMKADGTWVFIVQVASGVGTVLGGLLSGHLSRRLSDWVWFRVTTVGLGVLAVAYGLAPGLVSLAILQFVFGFVGIRAMASINTLVLNLTPPNQLGRVSSTINAVERGFYISISAAVGGMAGILPIHHVFILFGLISCVVAIVVAVIVRMPKAATSSMSSEQAP